MNFEKYLSENIVKMTVESIMESNSDEYDVVYTLNDTDDLHDILLFAEYDGEKIEMNDELYFPMKRFVDNLSDEEFAQIQTKVEEETQIDDVNSEILRGYYSDLL